MPEPMSFRVHHILCTNLYRGLGYDGAFCENMTAVVSRLRREPDTLLKLVTHPDAICLDCPNRIGEDFCSNGDNHVSVKDHALLEPLHLKEGSLYTYRELCSHAETYLSREVFEKSCCGCQWFTDGICRYEDFLFWQEKEEN